jgi:hypothetical protein
MPDEGSRRWHCDLHTPCALFLAVNAGALLILLAGAVFVMGGGFIPLIEVDRTVYSGSAYGFTIGMTKEDAFKTIRRRYDRQDHYVRVVWSKPTPFDAELAAYENTELQTARDDWGEHQVLVADLTSPSRPMELLDRWQVQIPFFWDNKVQLSFSGGRLAEIRRTRWLCERP